MATIHITNKMTCNNCNNQNATMEIDEAKELITFHCENCRN